LIIPIVPPGRHTRRSSSATAWWSAAQIAPTHDVTTSNSASPKRERLGVALHPVERDAEAAGLGAAGLEVLRRQVRGGHARAGRGGAQRRVARAGCDVEHTLARVDPARRHELGPELPDQLGRKAVVVAERPHRPHGGLALAVRDGLGHAGHRTLEPVPPHRPNRPSPRLARSGYPAARAAWAAAALRERRPSLRQDVGHVPVHGVLAEHETRGHLAVREPLGEQAEHLALAAGELGQRPQRARLRQPSRPSGIDGGSSSVRASSATRASRAAASARPSAARVVASATRACAVS
jgi:hypothetical protein